MRFRILISILFLGSVNRGQSNKKCFTVSLRKPHSQEGSSTRLFRNLSLFNLLLFNLNLVKKEFGYLLPVQYQEGGLTLTEDCFKVLTKHLCFEMLVILDSSEFQREIEEGTNDFLNLSVLHLGTESFRGFLKEMLLWGELRTSCI